jgi:hypothetical protein
MNYKNITTSQSILCKECGEKIIWSNSSTNDDEFISVVDKLISHMKNNKKCIRERKLNEIFDTKEKLAQDFWLK